MANGKVDKKERLIRQQNGRPARIPGGITPQDFLEMNKILENILKDIEAELRALRKRDYLDDEKPKELHVRLNESDKPWPFPVFVGWVESDDVRKRREEWNHPHPGLQRFSDDVYSEIYGEAFRYANAKDLRKRSAEGPPERPRFRHRDWAAGEILEKRSGEKATDPKSGNNFQTCLAIVIGGRAVGTLVVGFRQRPAAPLLERTQSVLGEWAREPKSPKRRGLINFLRKFELGGPRLRDSDWVARI